MQIISNTDKAPGGGSPDSHVSRMIGGFFGFEISIPKYFWFGKFGKYFLGGLI